MSNQELLIASEKGELEKVQQILINKGVNINCQNILSLKNHSISNSLFLMIFKFKLFYGILYLIIQ